MPRLMIVYDPNGRIEPCPKEAGMQQALIDLPDGLDGRDIYEIARKLAESLLETIGE